MRNKKQDFNFDSYTQTSLFDITELEEEPISAVDMVKSAGVTPIAKKDKPETKSKRFNFFIYPSLFDKLQLAARIAEQSAGDLLNDIIKDYVNAHADQIAEQRAAEEQQALDAAKEAVKAAKKGGKA